MAVSNRELTRSTDELREAMPEGAPCYEIYYADGRSVMHGSARPEFTLMLRNPDEYGWFLKSDLYTAAMAFIRGRFDICGDLVSAIRFKKAVSRPGARDILSAFAARSMSGGLGTWFQPRHRAASDIRFHYDRSNEFYQAFLDSKMLYSCAYFKSESDSLDEAQMAKLDHICRKLALQPKEAFLDVGCGWGALVMHAAEKYGALATGCTLSLRQEFFASRAILDRKLEGKAAVCERDYRMMNSRFQKIASVGMFEHVGRKRLRSYFRKIHSLLADDGLFLNHGIVRPEGISDGPETLFLQRKVFPGGELTTLSSVIREAGRAGFEVLDVESLRPHYALTCRHWVQRLCRNAETCLAQVDRETYRTWLLYLAGSALSFESGATDICQVLMAKRSTPRHLPLTRDYMYV